MKKVLCIAFALLLALGCLTGCGSKDSDSVSVAVPNDTSNEARALLLLEALGYIEVDDKAGITATINDITSNPKLTNFLWVADATVARADLQNRPTGVERWNGMTTDLAELRFTKAYEAPDRLSEFIGINETTKLSTDEELEAIYDLAHAAYLTRERDGSLWQTMHSVVYGPNGMEHLWVQEDWSHDYIASGASSAADVSYDNAASGLETDNVQGAIDELVSDKQSKAITDTGGYFAADTVEGALQELGAALSGVDSLIGSGVIV